MNRVSLAAALLSAGLAANAQAVTILSEGFESVAGLAASGWVLTNASTPAGLSWFQGNSGVYPASSGPADSYAAANFNSTTAVQGVVDNWLISPALTLGSGATLSFATRASDAGFLDRLEVRFSVGTGSATSSFSTLLASVGSAANPSYPVGSWVAYTLALPTAATGRVAFRYIVPNALDASYVGLDTVTVSAVPEPATLALLALGLAAVGMARQRSTASKLR